MTSLIFNSCCFALFCCWQRRDITNISHSPSCRFHWFGKHNQQTPLLAFVFFCFGCFGLLCVCACVRSTTPDVVSVGSSDDSAAPVWFCVVLLYFVCLFVFHGTGLLAGAYLFVFVCVCVFGVIVCLSHVCLFVLACLAPAFITPATCRSSRTSRTATHLSSLLFSSLLFFSSLLLFSSLTFWLLTKP